MLYHLHGLRLLLFFFPVLKVLAKGGGAHGSSHSSDSESSASDEGSSSHTITYHGSVITVASNGSCYNQTTHQLISCPSSSTSTSDILTYAFAGIFSLVVIFVIAPCLFKYCSQRRLLPKPTTASHLPLPPIVLPTPVNISSGSLPSYRTEREGSKSSLQLPIMWPGPFESMRRTVDSRLGGWLASLSSSTLCLAFSVLPQRTRVADLEAWAGKESNGVAPSNSRSHGIGVILCTILAAARLGLRSKLSVIRARTSVELLRPKRAVTRDRRFNDFYYNHEKAKLDPVWYSSSLRSFAVSDLKRV